MTDPFAPDPEHQWLQPTPIHERFAVSVALIVFTLSVLAFGPVFIAIAATLPGVHTGTAASGFHTCGLLGYALAATVVSLVAAVGGASWAQLRVVSLGCPDTCRPQVF